MKIDPRFPHPNDCKTLREVMPRMVLATLIAGIAIKVGLGYVHLCEAGSRVLETIAVLGTPILTVGAVLFARRWLVGVVLAMALIMACYFLRRPYLDWAHGNW